MYKTLTLYRYVCKLLGWTFIPWPLIFITLPKLELLYALVENLYTQCRSPTSLWDQNKLMLWTILHTTHTRCLLIANNFCSLNLLENSIYKLHLNIAHYQFTSQSTNNIIGVFIFAFKSHRLKSKYSHAQTWNGLPSMKQPLGSYFMIPLLCMSSE